MADTREFENALRAWARVFMRRSVHEFIVAMKDSGLSTSQLNSLMRLHYHGPCPITGLGDDLGVTTAAASQIVDRLATMGLIERSEDPNDRRVRQVTLTEAGRKLVARGIEARLAWTRDFAGRIPEAELPELIESLRRLTAAADEMEQARVPESALERTA
jgi:DNA-binding MarR family transcriptional regulator